MIDRSSFARLRTRLGLLLFGLALLAYAPSLAGQYLFDDIHSIADNPALQDPWAALTCWIDPDAFSRGAGKMYRPMLVSSFVLNGLLGAAAWSLKLGNLLLHGAVVVLLFRWLAALGHRLLPAAAAAALFAVHPLASEAVNFVSARSELLCAVGLLVGLSAQLAWLRGQAGTSAVVGMLLGTVVACGSKETGAVMPGLLAAQAFLLRQRRFERAELARTLAPLAAVVALVVAYLVVRKLLLGAVAVPLLERPEGDPRVGYGRTLVVQLATMGTLLPTALRQCVWPWPLSVDPLVVYRSSFAEPAVWSGWLLMLGLTVAALRGGPSARLRRVGVAFAWLVALPWIVVPLNMPYAEHRMYLPSCGLAAVVAATGPWLLAKLRQPFAAGGLATRAWIRHAPLAVLLAVFAAGAARRSWLFHDEAQLWAAELAQRDDSFAAWWGVGTLAMRQGDLVAAVAPLQRAHALNPQNVDALRNLVEAMVGVPMAAAQPALAHERAVELQRRMPDDPWFRTLLVRALLQRGHHDRNADDFRAAEQWALSCLEIAKPKGYVFQLAAEARRGLGDLPGALAHLDTSIARGLAPNGVRADRVLLLRELGRVAEARRELAALQASAPFDPAVQMVAQRFAAPPK